MTLWAGDIAFIVALGFLAGILAASFVWPVMVVLGASVTLGFFIFLFSRERRFLYGMLFAGVAVFTGASYFYFFTNWTAAAMRLPPGSAGSFTIMVSGDPTDSGNYLYFSAELRASYRGNIMVFAPTGSDIRYGDLLNIAGAIEPPRTAGEASAVFPKNIETISHGNGFWFKEKLLDMKTAMLGKFADFLPPDEAALLGGMTFGGTSGMSPALKRDMASSETLYVTSMYGYKIAMIVFVIEAIFAGILPRRIRFFVAGLVAVLFVVMAGGGSSAIRGGAVACLLMLGRDTGSVISKRNMLTLLAAGMALVDPTVVQQAGFLFSFASVAGMTLLAGPIKKFLRPGEGRGMFGWKEAVVLSVASLMPLIPLISAMFGSFSLTAVLANILIAPVVPFGMALGASLAVLGFFSQFAAFFVAHIASAVLYYAFWIIEFFAAHTVPLPFSFSGALPFLAYYGAVGLFAYAYREDRKIMQGIHG